jgi:hypothetical protein
MVQNRLYGVQHQRLLPLKQSVMSPIQNENILTTLDIDTLFEHAKCSLKEFSSIKPKPSGWPTVSVQNKILSYAYFKQVSSVNFRRPREFVLWGSLSGGKLPLVINGRLGKTWD